MRVERYTRPEIDSSDRTGDADGIHIYEHVVRDGRWRSAGMRVLHGYTYIVYMNESPRQLF